MSQIKLETKNQPNRSKSLNSFYNSKQGTFLGRTFKSWCKILLFYTIYYTFLAILFFSALSWSKSRVKKDKPISNNVRLDQPGISVIPMNGFEKDKDNLEFPLYDKTKSWPTSDYIEEMQSFLKRYIDCNQTELEELKIDEFFNFKDEIIDQESIFKEEYFSQMLNENKTVIFLQVNRIINWRPISYNPLELLAYDQDFGIDQNLRDYLVKNINSMYSREVNKNRVYFNCFNYNARALNYEKADTIYQIVSDKPYIDYEIDFSSRYQSKHTAPVCNKKPVAKFTIKFSSKFKETKDVIIRCNAMAKNIQYHILNDPKFKTGLFPNGNGYATFGFSKIEEFLAFYIEKITYEELEQKEKHEDEIIDKMVTMLENLNKTESQSSEMVSNNDIFNTFPVVNVSTKPDEIGQEEPLTEEVLNEENLEEDTQVTMTSLIEERKNLNDTTVDFSKEDNQNHNETMFETLTKDTEYVETMEIKTEKLNETFIVENLTTILPLSKIKNENFTTEEAIIESNATTESIMPIPTISLVTEEITRTEKLVDKKVNNITLLFPMDTDDYEDYVPYDDDYYDEITTTNSPMIKNETINNDDTIDTLKITDNDNLPVDTENLNQIENVQDLEKSIKKSTDNNSDDSNIETIDSAEDTSDEIKIDENITPATIPTTEAEPKVEIADKSDNRLPQALRSKKEIKQNNQTSKKSVDNELLHKLIRQSEKEKTQIQKLQKHEKEMQIKVDTIATKEDKILVILSKLLESKEAT